MRRLVKTRLAVLALVLAWPFSGFAQTPAPPIAPYFTGVVSRVENHVKLTAPDGHVYTLASQGPDFHNQWAGDTMGFAGQTITVQGWPDATGNTIVLEGFAPGTGHDFLTARVQGSYSFGPPTGELTLKAEGNRTIKIADPALKAKLASWNQAGLILRGNTTWDGNGWVFTPTADDVWMLVILNAPTQQGAVWVRNATTPAGSVLMTSPQPWTDNVINRRMVHGTMLPETTAIAGGTPSKLHFAADAISAPIEHVVKYQAVTDGQGLNVARGANTVPAAAAYTLGGEGAPGFTGGGVAR